MTTGDRDERVTKGINSRFVVLVLQLLTGAHARP